MSMFAPSRRLPDSLMTSQLSLAAGSQGVPPAPAADQTPWHRRLGTWLVSSLGERCDATLLTLNPSARRLAALLDARTAFRSAVDDIPRPAATAALEHIRSARSLPALWDLRNEIFSLVSCHHDQHEATRRLALLDPHFSRRLRHSAASRAGVRTRSAL
jgi:hypothetical protein